MLPPTVSVYESVWIVSGSCAFLTSLPMSVWTVTKWWALRGCRDWWIRTRSEQLARETSSRMMIQTVLIGLGIYSAWTPEPVREVLRERDQTVAVCLMLIQIWTALNAAISAWQMRRLVKGV